jgi:penicillin-binding protein 1C
LSQAFAESWFILPPIQEFYYKKSHPLYKALPPFRNDCLAVNSPTMEFIYPKNGSKIILAKNFEGNKNELIFKLAHAKPETKVFWYLNSTFVKETKDFHEVALLPDVGVQTISVVDELGNEAKLRITVE